MEDLMPVSRNACVMIVGGAGGIGRSAAGLFRRNGWDIMLADRDPAGLGDAASSLPPGQGSVSTIVLDMNDRESVRRAAGQMEGGGIRIGALVVVAAVHGTWPAELLPDAEIDRVMSTNLTSHIRLVRDLLPLMHDGSRLVGVSSIAASARPNSNAKSALPSNPTPGPAGACTGSDHSSATATIAPSHACCCSGRSRHSRRARSSAHAIAVIVTIQPAVASVSGSACGIGLIEGLLPEA